MRGSITTCFWPCASRPRSTAARISVSVSARRSTSGPLRKVRWMGCTSGGPMKVKVAKIRFGIDQGGRYDTEEGYESARVHEPHAKSCDRIGVDVNEQSHQKRRAQSGERMDRVGDTQQRASLCWRRDLTDQGRAECKDDTAYRKAQSHQGNFEQAATREWNTGQRGAAEDNAK